MKILHCPSCDQQVYFDNLRCLSCAASLAFEPLSRTMLAFGPTWGDGVVDTAKKTTHQPCRHRLGARACNWAVPTKPGAAPECDSCRLTDAAASAPEQGHQARWFSAESAKRRLLYTLLELGISTHASHAGEDTLGLRFVWQVPSAGKPVLTGHDGGTVTLNLLEADDDHRESARVAFGEPLRTVLGHLRHEVSHYLDARWVDTDPALAKEFTALMGDKSLDYPKALEHHYAHGAPADWQEHHISAYASAHPWEDWAETCAHYLLMVDAVETATQWGLGLDNVPDVRLGDSAHVFDLPADDLVLQQWLPVSRFLNSMARSIGVRDNYPFVVAQLVIQKMAFVRKVLLHARAVSSADQPKKGPST